MQKTKVATIQVNNGFSGQHYLPYSVGLLQAYYEKHGENKDSFEFLLPVFMRESVADVFERIKDADIFAFSAYVWNVNFCLELARKIKEYNAESLVVFGGPQVPDVSDEFLTSHRFIDVAVHGEGERVFTQLLDTFPARNWDSIPGISYINGKGEFVNNAKAARSKTIDDLPSPFLSGTFDKLIEAHPEQTWIGLWETNRGCPFACTFCDWGSATANKVQQFEQQRLEQELDWFSSHKIEYIFCCDANFGMLPRDVDLAKYAVKNKSEHGYPKALSVQNTKNATERAYSVQKILSDGGLNKGVTLSMQSTDSTTLESVKRKNISLHTYEELQYRFMKDNIITYSDLILGMPGETMSSFIKGICEVLEHGQHNRIQFNNLSVLPNAEMGNPEYQKKYGMVLVESDIINIHGELKQVPDGIVEKQQLVVATASMPKPDWVKVRSYSWLVSLLHFDKLLQIPILFLHKVSGLAYNDIFDSVFAINDSEFPILSHINQFFEEKAVDIQNGGVEYVYSKEWLGIYWPADEYVFIDLVSTNRLEDFYSEIKRVLANKFSNEIDMNMLDEAIDFNAALVKLPGVKKDRIFAAKYPWAQFYESAVKGRDFVMEAKDTVYRIDRTTDTWANLEQWSKEVVWYCNKKGAYLYGADGESIALAGHY